MKKIFFDLQTSETDYVLCYLQDKTMYIGACSFAHVDKSIGHMIKHFFKDIDKVFLLQDNFIDPKKATTTEKMQTLILNQTKRYICGWNISEKLKMLLVPNRLGNVKRMHEEQAHLQDFNYRKLTDEHLQKTASYNHYVDIQMLNEKAFTIQNGHKVYSSLETQCLYAGLDLWEKPVLSESHNQEDLEALIMYTISRVLCMKKLFETPLYQSSFEVKKNIIERFNLEKKAWLADTDSKLASLAIADDANNDSEFVNLNYPAKSGTVDMLTQVPQVVADVYRNVNQQNVTSAKQLSSLVKNTNILYENNAGYIRLSSGGAHGSACFETSLDSSLNTVTNMTTDTEHAFSVDVDSMYPTLAINLGIFGKQYQELRDERLAIKKQITEKFDEELNLKQLANKKILNAITGAGNTFKKNAILKLDNRIISMRIIGNLLIYKLASLYADLGAQILLTNTDGLKINYPQGDLKEVAEIAKEFGEEYGLTFEVKQSDRLIVKDANNYIEWINGKVHAVGKISRGLDGKIPLDCNVDRPLIVNQAMIDYFDSKSNDSNFFKEYFYKKWNTEYKSDEWSLFVRPNEKTKYFYDDNELPCITKCYYVIHGKKITKANSNGKNVKITGWTSDLVEVTNTPNFSPTLSNYSDDTVDIVKLDLNAYVQMALNVLKNWNKTSEPPVKNIKVNKKAKKEDLSDLALSLGF